MSKLKIENVKRKIDKDGNIIYTIIGGLKDYDFGEYYVEITKYNDKVKGISITNKDFYGEAETIYLYNDMIKDIIEVLKRKE